MKAHCSYYKNFNSDIIFHRIQVVIICLFCSFSSSLSAQENEVDRLEKQLPHLSGKAKLDTLVKMIDLTIHTSEKVRGFLELYEQEAIKQNNLKSQSLAKGKLVEYYMAHFSDSAFIVAKDAIAFAQEHKFYNFLFGIKQMLVQLHAWKERYAEAVKLGKEMQSEAKETGDYFCQALVASAIGNSYSSMGLGQDALNYFKEGVACLNQYNDLARSRLLYLNLYHMILHEYTNLNDVENIILYADTLQLKIDEFAARKFQLNYKPFRFRVQIGYASALIKKKDAAQAWKHVYLADSLYRLQMIPNDEYEVNCRYADYYGLVGDDNKALLFSEKCIDFLKENELTDALIGHQVNHVYYLLRLGRYKEATSHFEEIHETLLDTEAKKFNSQISQLRVLYDLDKIELQAENDRLELDAAHDRMIMYVVVIMLLIIIIGIVILNMQRIRKKNIGLVQRIREQERIEEEMERQQEELKSLRLLQVQQTDTSIDESLEENSLITKLKSLLKETHAYTDPAMNRKMLADMLGTNENYLRTAIKEKLGYTFNEYMNELRLNHAKKLLALPSEEYTIETIAFESGFGTRSTLHRQFHNKYGLSPGEYRKLINSELK